MSKTNFEITDKETGKKYWISRAVVVIPLVFKTDNFAIYTLIEKRGKAVSNTGKWCCPCGYLDWDETFEEACAREVREETGLEVSPDDFFFVGYNSVPSHFDKQNVSMRFVSFVSPYTELDMSKIETKDEITELKWIKVADFIKNSGEMYLKIDYNSLNNSGIKWAFEHNKIIPEMLTAHYKKHDINVI